MATRVLIVDDDPIVAESVAELLRERGHTAATALDAEEALAALTQAEQDRRGFEVVVCDVSLPHHRSGMELLKEVRTRHPQTAVVMLTGYGSIETAVESLRGGAVDFLTKPVVDAELLRAVDRAAQQAALNRETTSLRRRMDARSGLAGIVGQDHRMRRVYELVEAVAASRTTVLMSGESGTGKSLIASAIHQMSTRSGGPFVELACGSIPETLLESELFGHVKGAFTGAHADKEGKFAAADGGTIFLDEINSASPGMQLKLLRVLQERKFEPVGSNKTIEVDTRVILATNQSLEELVAAGRFRQDLYYRINVVKVELPPLRERVSDIPMLAEHFLKEQSAEQGRVLAGFTPAAMESLRRYAFPGNVRELSNIVERAAVLCRGQTVDVTDLPTHVVDGGDHGVLRLLSGMPLGGDGSAEDGPHVPMTLEEAMLEPERRVIVRALEANGWNRQATADELGINRTTLYKKMKALGVEGEEKKAG